MGTRRQKARLTASAAPAALRLSLSAILLMWIRSSQRAGSASSQDIVPAGSEASAGWMTSARSAMRVPFA